MEPRSRSRGAMVLSATLALGGCQLASHPPPEGERRVAPPVRPAPPPAPSAEAPPAEPELEAETARVAELEASPGFTPDPKVATGTTAGGPLDAGRFDERCGGWIAARPDVIVRARRPFAELAVMAASRADTTLMVVGPEGDARCADDEDGPHPLLRASFDAGTYRIWVGTRERGAEASFVLGLSELDDSRPAALLH